MESATTALCNSGRDLKTLETNWMISSGSLESSVTFESPSTSTADEDVQSESSKHRSPLVLSPPSSGSNPCEITMTFTGRHEVQQVYVRSTARVYEIYYKTKVQSHNEYLCTVRCGIAAKDTCRTNDYIDACLTSIRESDYHQSAEERAKSEGNSNAGEDDWVEIKAPTNIAKKDDSTNVFSCHNMDFYEATAQIADADPCVSLMIRLVSIQSGNFVYVDEVYVFSDPVGPDVESEDAKVVNSAGSSLMAMLVPTLLQLSKRTDSTNAKDDKHSCGLVNKKQLSEVGSGLSNLGMHPIASALPDTTKRSEDETKCNTADHHKIQAFNSEPTQQRIKLDHIEEVLEQLASRIVRIEDICLRFEEKMLKPISCIEARLQSVEQQLEMLNDKSSKGQRNCNQFSAPEYSFSESNVNSLQNDVNCHEAVELEKDSSDGSSIPVDDVHVSASSAQLVPSLAIVAPVFSEDDSEEGLVSEQTVDSLERNPRPAVSLDDALASALAGFMSSTSHFKERARSPTVKHSDVQNEANDIHVQRASPKNKQSKATDFSAYLKGADGKEYEECSATSTNEAFVYYNSEEVAQESDEVQPRENEKYNLLQTGGDITIDAAKEKAVRVELVEVEEANPESSHSLVDSMSGITFSVSADATIDDTGGTVLQQDINSFGGLPKMKMERSDGAETSCEVLAADETVASNKLDGSCVEEEAAQPGSMQSVPVMKSKSEADIVENGFIFSQHASAVDFNVPILDVQFISLGISNTKSPLEAILADLPESNIASPCDEQSHDACAYEEQPNLIVVDDANPSLCATNSNLTVNFDCCDLDELPGDDSENLQANFACGYVELLSGSLI